MKIKLILSVIAILLAAIAFAYSLTGYSPTGWSSLTGATSSPGKAYNLIETGNGFTFFCEGNGVCFQIIGNNLEINEGNGSMGGSFWSVFPN